MCILRYLPAMLPSRSSTTAVLWYSPAARRSNSEPTSTTPCCLRELAEALGARAGNRLGQVELVDAISCWQKYGAVVQFLQQHQLARRARRLRRRRRSITARLASALAAVAAPGSGRRAGVCGVAHASTVLAASCIVTQCRLPFCQISGRQGTCTISRPGKACASTRGGLVVGGVAVGRHQHRAVDDQEVGVATRPGGGRRRRIGCGHGSGNRR